MVCVRDFFVPLSLNLHAFEGICTPLNVSHLFYLFFLAQVQWGSSVHRSALHQLLGETICTAVLSVYSCSMSY